MDKEFIKIDDLFSQRLSGAEERERAGAWLDMRELLDKEMPQRRVAAIFWRRAFGAVAALLLIAAITVGSYQLSAYKNLNGSNDVAANTPAPAAHPGNADISSTTIATDGMAGDTRNDNSNKKAADITRPATNNRTERTAHHTAKNTVNTTNATAANTPGNDVPGAVNEKPGKPATAEKSNASADKKNIASIDKKNNGPAHEQVTASATSSPKPAEDNTTGKLANNTTGHHRSSTKKNTDHTAAPAKPTPASGTASVASATKPAANKVPVSPSQKHTAGSKTTDIHNMALASGSSSTHKPSTAATVRTSAANNHAVAKKTAVAKLPAGDKAIANKVADAPVAGVAANNGPTGNTSGTAMAGTGNGSGKPSMRNAPTANNVRGKKTIERMVVLQRNIKTSERQADTHIDTISIEMLTEEFGGKPGAEKPESASSPEMIASSAARTNSTSGAMAANNPNSAAPSTAAPQAAPPATQPGTAPAKENNTAKRSEGNKPLENLRNEFNDIKTRVSMVRFAPGITAGVNGTFFGPNSFKGFQFGFTGELIFNDDIGIMAELKYFHRINNNFEIDDNYYNYTNLGNGSYSKQAVQSIYAFSTLHSIEMPISIRYVKGNFNFFVGGNLIYSFAINTGATPAMPVNGSTASTVTSVSNDNAPKYAASDFASRFGLGYLCGVSYKVSPNVTFDLRDVQTVWDNARSAGSKAVSTELYKSPSFQLSLSYRLGGKRKD
jgi:hypothetical protein